ncbi:PhoPQ-activated protein PqaA family protein [Verrucomicrobiaceae bacterium 227]
MRSTPIALLLCLLPFILQAQEKSPPVPTNALQAYLEKPDSTTEWKSLNKITIGESDVWHLSLQSQTWQNIPWTHDLLLIRPKNAPPTKKILLINSGGSFKPTNMGDLMFGATLAQRINAPVAVLLGIPKQPLFNGLREDDLIAETFVRYLDSGDANWPLLFPMVKSLVKAMDTIQEFSRKNWTQPVEKFIVTGASKRGWTTWLTAAADPRVSAIAPMVIDVLNIPKQIPHQTESFGEPSEQISPYTKRELIPLPDTERASSLWKMVDPFTYRKKFTMPKIIVLGNNDRFWSTDSLNLYWDEIPEPKYISYTPNAGHSLTEVDANGKKLTPMRSIDNISAFVRLHLQDQLPPNVNWTHSDTADGKLQLEVKTDTPPKEARLWYAHSKSRDFRDSRWHSRPLKIQEDGSIHLTQDAPVDDFYAYYIDLSYPVDDLTLWLCTQLRIATPTK